MILNVCEWLGFGGHQRSKFNRIVDCSTRLPGLIVLAGQLRQALAAFFATSLALVAGQNDTTRVLARGL
jgi:hypothetical protein